MLGFPFKKWSCKPDKELQRHPCQVESRENEGFPLDSRIFSTWIVILYPSKPPELLIFFSGPPIRRPDIYFPSPKAPFTEIEFGPTPPTFSYPSCCVLSPPGRNHTCQHKLWILHNITQRGNRQRKTFFRFFYRPMVLRLMNISLKTPRLPIIFPEYRAHLCHEFEAGIGAKYRFIFLLTFHILFHRIVI